MSEPLTQRQTIWYIKIHLLCYGCVTRLIWATRTVDRKKENKSTHGAEIAKYTIEIVLEERRSEVVKWSLLSSGFTGCWRGKKRRHKARARRCGDLSQ